MTDAQTEARAIVAAALPPHEQAILGHDAVTVLTDLIDTALAAKDAELAAVRSERDAIVTAAVNRGLTLEAELAEAVQEIERLKNLVGDPEGTAAHAEAFLARAERAEAQPAEANKALEDWRAGMRPSGWSRDQHAANPRVNLSRDGEKALADIAARRAREAQGGKNG